MSLSAAHVAIIKATAPVVGENALKITSTFYGHMLTENPEVLKYFNRTNQATKRQPKALADAVVAYASNIDNLGVLGDAVGLMAHKHVALQVTPEGYDIVGHHLMNAIHEVLGEAVTQDIHDAWAAAYGQLAGILIDAEAALYEQQRNAPGGWNHWRDFQVTHVEKVAPTLLHVSLRSSDGKAAMASLPGQYLSLLFNGNDLPQAVTPDQPHIAPRHYSIVRHCEDGYDLVIRRVDNGLYSEHIHDAVKVGSVLKVGAPIGPFTLPQSERPFVAIAGGVGFTPLVSMAHAAKDAGRAVHVLHSAASAADNAAACRFFPEGTVTTVDTSSRPRLTGDDIVDFVRRAGADIAAADVAVCAPAEMVVDAGRALLNAGFPRSQLKYEYFGPHISF